LAAGLWRDPKLKIFWSVVRSDAVPVVHVFPVIQRSSESFFHDETMLEYTPAITEELSISMNDSACSGGRTLRFRYTDISTAKFAQVVHIAQTSRLVRPHAAFNVTGRGREAHPAVR
jgi:hypothetical protein